MQNPGNYSWQKLCINLASYRMPVKRLYRTSASLGKCISAPWKECVSGCSELHISLFRVMNMNPPCQVSPSSSSAPKYMILSVRADWYTLATRALDSISTKVASWKSFVYRLLGTHLYVSDHVRGLLYSQSNRPCPLTVQEAIIYHNNNMTDCTLRQIRSAPSSFHFAPIFAAYFII